MKTTKKDALANGFATFKNQQLENPDAIKGGKKIAYIVRGQTKLDNGTPNDTWLITYP